ncbi:MAG: hypothetical protein WCI36_02555 [bacterium]
MKKYFVFFDRKTIQEFLFKYGKGSNSKDYELIVAIALSASLEDMWKIPNVIGFELLDKYVRDLPDSGMISIEQVEKIIRKYVEEKSPVDIAIAKGTIASHEPRGSAFQLKRFGMNAQEKSTSSLVDFLNEMPRKYSKNEVSLFVILEKGVEISPSELQKAIITDNYPFNKIMFMIMMNNKLMIGEFWPKSGMNEYDPEKLIDQI